MLSLNVQPPGRGEDQGKQVGTLGKAQKTLGPKEYGTQAHEKLNLGLSFILLGF